MTIDVEKTSKNKGISFSIGVGNNSGCECHISCVGIPIFLITLGENIFSSIAVGEVLALYVLIFSLYSFDIISVQKVISSVTKDEIFKVYILTLICRLCLFVISGICLLFITYLINKTLSVYLGLFLLYPVGMILQSNYFFRLRITIGHWLFLY